MSGNSVLSDKREFAWIGNGEFTNWLQTPPLIGKCNSINIKLVSVSKNPDFEAKLMVRLVKSGEVVACEEVNLVNSSHLAVYSIDHKMLEISEAGDVIEVLRYSGSLPHHQLHIKGVALVLEGAALPLSRDPQFFHVTAKSAADVGTVLKAVSPDNQLVCSGHHPIDNDSTCQLNLSYFLSTVVWV